MSRKPIAVLTLFLSVLWSIACVAGPPATEGSGKPDGVFPRTLVHPFGETTVPAEPHRIVVVSTGQLDALLTLGIVPLGATRVDGQALYANYLTKAFPDLKLDGIADLGGRASPNVEAIAQLHPDLILMNAALGKRDLYERLSHIAPTMITHGTGVNWRGDFLLLADSLGRRGDAERYLGKMTTEAHAFAARWQGHPPSVSFTMAMAGRTRVFGPNSFSGGIAEDLGLGRPASQQFKETSQDISEELLDRADADWIFYGTRSGAREGAFASPLWPGLKGVENGHAVAVDVDPFYLNAGPTAARFVQEALIASLGR